jgi:phospholipid transport system substrate-binding protein
LSLNARANAATPDELVRRLANELTDAVRADSELQNPYSERMAEFMRKRVVPRFNFELITRSVIGKNWIKATSDERRTLVDKFSQLMIRNYAKAVAMLKNFDIEVQSVKVITPNEDVIVHTRMIGLPQSYNVDYEMAADDGGWRVHDITFEGVSLVNSYRDEFNSLINTSGIDGLIADLEKRNGD